MTLQTSGAISINDLATEFGGTAPHSLSEYYRGGGLVPDTGANSGIPTSGQIQLDDFYGGDVTTGLSGKMYVWGGGKGGSKAEATNSTLDTPSEMSSVSGSYDVKCVGESGWHTSCLRTDGRVWVCGKSDQGSKCDGTAHFTQTDSFTQVLPSVNTWASFSTGGGVNTGVRTDGRWWVGGYYSTSPQLTWSSMVENAQGGTSWLATSPNTTSACSGDYTSYCIRSDGRLWGLGNNGSGSLGNGTNTYRSSPVETSLGGTSWASVMTSSSGANLGAIKTDGRLWNCGQNTYGNVGDGSTTQRFSLVEINGGGTSWVNVFHGGNGASGGVKTDGRLWVWGRNTYYQLGIGSQSQWSLSPIQTSAGGTSWVVGGSTGGGQATAAVKSDGRMWAWGYGGFRAAGQGTNNVSTPTQVWGSYTSYVWVAGGQWGFSSIKS